MEPKKRVIALVAHDGMPKQDICKFINYGKNKEILKNFDLIGTEATAKMIHEICQLDVRSIGHGPAGGDIKIANELIDGRLDYLFFFINYDLVQAHQVDIDMLVRWAAKRNIPLAVNRATADCIIQTLANPRIET